MNTKSGRLLKCLTICSKVKERFTNEIANYLSMKPSSVSDMLKKLSEKNVLII